MPDLLVLAAVGLGTLGFRAFFIVRRETAVPARLAGLLPYVAPAALAAICLPGLLPTAGGTSAREMVAALVAAAATVIVWRWLGRFPHALLAGLATWWFTLGAFSIVG